MPILVEQSGLPATDELPALKDWVVPSESSGESPKVVVDAEPYEEIPEPAVYHPDLGPPPEIGSPEHPLTDFQKEGMEFVSSLRQGAVINDRKRDRELLSQNESYRHGLMLENMDNIYNEVAPIVAEVSAELVRGNEHLYTQMISETYQHLASLSEGVLRTSEIYDKDGFVTGTGPTAEFLNIYLTALPKFGVDIENSNLDMSEVLKSSQMSQKEFDTRVAAIKQAETMAKQGKGHRSTETVTSLYEERFDRSMLYAEKLNIMSKFNTYPLLRRRYDSDNFSAQDFERTASVDSGAVDLKYAQLALACFETANAAISCYREIVKKNPHITSEEDMPDYVLLRNSVKGLVLTGRVLLDSKFNEELVRLKTAAISNAIDSDTQPSVEQMLIFREQEKKRSESTDDYAARVYLKGDPGNQSTVTRSAGMNKPGF